MTSLFSDEAETLCDDVGVTRLTSNLARANIPGAALGLVHIKNKGEWGTVCDDDFDEADAKVVPNPAFLKYPTKMLLFLSCPR